MQWKPNRSKPLIAGIPLKRPSQEQVNKAYMLFYSMIGGFASVVQTQITDVYNYARQDKKLFRMEAKKRLTEAKRCSDELVESFMFYMGRIGMQQIWLDLTDAIEEDIRPDIQKCFYALDNQFLKFGIKQHKLYTLILMAEILSRMLCKSVDEFSSVMQKNYGMTAFSIDSRFTMPVKGVYARIRNVMELLYPLSVDNKVFADCKDKFNLGFEIIGMKVLDYQRADNALFRACKLNGVNIEPDGSEKKNPIVNTGTPWNEAQIRALTIGFPNTPTKEVAHVVGRSVYEVNKKAKELGLEKSPEYLKTIRTANLKRKQNEEDSKAIYQE